MREKNRNTSEDFPDLFAELKTPARGPQMLIAEATRRVAGSGGAQIALRKEEQGKGIFSDDVGCAYTYGSWCVRNHISELDELVYIRGTHGDSNCAIGPFSHKEAQAEFDKYSSVVDVILNKDGRRDHVKLIELVKISPPDWEQDDIVRQKLSFAALNKK